MAADSTLIGQSACDIVDLLHLGAITPLDLIDTLEARIAAVEPHVNALPILCLDRARRAAEELMREAPEARGPLAGLPVPIKDLTDVAGVRTTYGSRIFADHVPDRSDLLVEGLEASGAIVYAKSNTPEFGAGANTFNDVFGSTLNPWNTARSAAGSSGGAAVALATGMAWIAHGSDMGGSLRNPASFCGVVGLRPSPGRVAHGRKSLIDDTLSADGPMARNVADLALMLDAMSGADPGDPLSLPRESGSFLAAARARVAPARVAFSADLGITPVDPEVKAIVSAAARRFEAAGVVVEEAHPDLSEAHDCFQTLRALNFAVNLGAHLERHRDLLKPEIVWNVEKGLALTPADIARAEHQRVAMYHRMLGFFETYDLLLTPATVVAPYPVEQRFVDTVAGVTLSNYVEWLAIAYAITLVCCPAMSIPAGFTAQGLPVGIQLVGRPRGEAGLIGAAAVLEAALDLNIAPIDPRPAA